MRVCTIVGARPQFIKAASISRALREANHREFLVHTGQHYDEGMSQVFFDELDLPAPDVHLGVGSGTHGGQTGRMLIGVEEILLRENPDWTVVYGDTNSTLAGALAAAKLDLPIAHVEAGLRSFRRSMPEEINRVVADHLSRLLLCPSQVAVANLAREGIHRGVHVVGDVMADSLSFAAGRARERSQILRRLELKPQRYLMATVHRAENTDDLDRLRNILSAFGAIREPIVFPIHPRTRRALESADLQLPANVRPVEPLGYLDTVGLLQEARMILTDSGGLQKEAYWLGVRCVTLREETEWVETVDNGWNVLAGADAAAIVEAARADAVPERRPSLYGASGGGAARCVQLMERGPGD